MRRAKLKMRILKLKEVMGCTALSRSTIYKYLSEDRFPKPISLGERSVGWLDSEVEEWILARIAERDEAA